jgi:glycosyltransferase involved in cell wall biosynthesis
MTPFFSICIPAYGMSGKGAFYLDQALRSIYAQTFTDYEVIVSDHSTDDALGDVCKTWQDRLRLLYLKNEENRGSSSANVNHAIRHAKGTWIKPLFQDDFFYTTTALLELKLGIQPGRWIASGCWHIDQENSRCFQLHKPRWNKRIPIGINTLGAPSLVAFPNQNHYFDDRLIWLMDCELYDRLKKAYGIPILLPQPLIVVRQWPGSVTETLATQQIRDDELAYVQTKYGPKTWRDWWNR